MGYRSVVAYTIRFIPHHPNNDIPTDDDREKAKGSFFTFLAEAKSKDTIAGAFKDEYLKVDEENLTINFFAEDVKWYESYEDVQCHECLMGLSREWAEDGDCSCPYIGGVFARIGEELEDNVYECWGEGDYDWIRIDRFVECDWLN